MPTVLYVGGLGRSGSTVLDLMLGQVPGFVAVGELAYLWGRADEDLCGCGREFGVCPFWQDVGERAFGGWNRSDRIRIASLRARSDRNRAIPSLLLSRGRSLSADQRGYVDAMQRVYQAVAVVGGARVVVDSTKHPSTAFLVRAMPDIDLRVAHLIRDPRGVAYSWTKRTPRPGIAGGAMMDRYPPWRMAMRWNTHNAAFHALAWTGTPTVRIRYEDMVDEPQPVLDSALRIAGESPPSAYPFLRGHELQIAEEHTIAGNPMRFERGPLTLRPDEAWRERLGAGQRRLVTAITSPLLGAYGYLR